MNVLCINALTKERFSARVSRAPRIGEHVVTDRAVFQVTGVAHRTELFLGYDQRTSSDGAMLILLVIPEQFMEHSVDQDLLNPFPDGEYISPEGARCAITPDPDKPERKVTQFEANEAVAISYTMRELLDLRLSTAPPREEGEEPVKPAEPTTDSEPDADD